MGDDLDRASDRSPVGSRYPARRADIRSPRRSDASARTRSGSASRRLPSATRLGSANVARMPPGDVFDPNDGAEQRAGGAARGRDVPALPVLEVFEELGRRRVLARVLTPALRLAPVLFVRVVSDRINGRTRRRLRDLVRRRPARPPRSRARPRPMPRGAHVVGPNQLVAGAARAQEHGDDEGEGRESHRAQICNDCSHRDFAGGAGSTSAQTLRRAPGGADFARARPA